MPSSYRKCENLNALFHVFILVYSLPHCKFLHHQNVALHGLFIATSTSYLIRFAMSVFSSQYLLMPNSIKCEKQKPLTALFEKDNSSLDYLD